MRRHEALGLRALTDLAGLPAPDETAAAWLWPSRKLAVAFDATASRSLRSQGWKVVSALGTVADLLASLGAATGVTVPMPRAVQALCVAWGAPSLPVKGRWPEAKVALELPGTRSEARTRRDWQVVALDGAWREAMARMWEAVLAVSAFEGGKDATNPSQVEQALVLALAASGCPPIRRDVEIVDPDSRQVISRPDICWPDVLLAVELDGWWWHSGQSLDVILSADDPAAARRALQHADRTRFERDARKRRRIVALGWTVVSVVDTEMGRLPAAEIAGEIAAVYRHVAGKGRRYSHTGGPA